MGEEIRMECPKCGYKFDMVLGFGFTYEIVYKETVEKAKSGKLGKEIKHFIEKYKDGGIDISMVTLCCDECGWLTNDMDLTMYETKPGRLPFIQEDDQTPKTIKEIVDRWIELDSEQTAVEYMKYPHKCKKCKGKMHVVDEDEAVKCPHCKVAMEAKGALLWD